VHPDAVVNPLCPGFARRVVRCDHESFVTGSTQMLEYPDY
jgi:hypothetical protein